MSKCKFCKNQAFISVKRFGYNKFGVCSDCFNWLLFELDNLDSESTGDKNE